MHCREPALALLLLAAASGAPADDRHGEPARKVVVYATEHGGWIETTIELTPRASLERGLELLILTYEKDLVTRVERGENARRTLRHDYVVRAAKTVSAPRVGVITEKWRLDPTWNEDELGVAVLLQHPQSLQIFAAEAADLR